MQAFNLAEHVAMDADPDFPEVRRAAEALIEQLLPKDCGLDIDFTEAVTGGPEK